MSNTTQIPLVSSEITGIWNSYIAESLLACKFQYFLNSVEDVEIKGLLQQNLDLCNGRIKILSDIFNGEQLPIPDGFNEKDVNINAPRLFTDNFYLQYLCYVSKVGMQNYTSTLNEIARNDIRDYFSKCILDYVDLYNKSTELKLSKGIFIRTPHVEVPKSIQYVKSEQFMLNWFGKKRPLLTSEITHIFSMALGTIIRKTLFTAFAQVYKDKKISEYILRGRELASKQNDILNSLLEKEDIPVPSSSDMYVTDSTVSPFSEKLIMNKILIMCSTKIGSIGIALSDAKRNDLQNIYIKFTEELIKYTKDILDMMISKKLFEQPPQAIDHKNLAGIK